MVPGLFLAALAVVFWSTNAVVAKIVLAEASVAQVLILQFAGAAITLLMLRLAVAPWRTTRSPSAPGLWVLGLIGIVGTISFQYLAFRYSPIVQANIIAYGWPLFAAVWWAMARRSSNNAWFVVCAVLGFAGIALIIGNGQSLDLSYGFLSGYLFALASSLCMAFYTIAAGQFRHPSPAVLLPALSIGLVGTLLLTVQSGTPWPAAPYIWLGAYIGVGPMALGYFLWMRAMSSGNPAALAQIGFATPLLSTFWLFLAGETLTGAALAGAVLVIGTSIAAMVIDRAERRQRSTEEAISADTHEPEMPPNEMGRVVCQRQ